MLQKALSLARKFHSALCTVRTNVSKASRSGKSSDRATPVISKRGKADLRYALYQASLIASLKNKYFIIYYTNKLRGRAREKGISAKVRVKLAAKLLVIAWTLMKKKEHFDPAYLNRGDSQVDLH